MTATQFVKTYQLREADAIVLRKKILGMVDHYAVFVGFRGSQPVFIANYRDGVKEVTNAEMREMLVSLQPVNVDRFPGTEYERQFAITRALSRVGEKAYNYIANNCEHFKNWVHHGENRSKQVDMVGNVAIGAGLGIGIFAVAQKNPKAGLLALGLVLIGAGLKKAAED